MKQTNVIYLYKPNRRNEKKYKENINSCDSQCACDFLDSPAVRLIVKHFDEKYLNLVQEIYMNGAKAYAFTP